ncbi:MULTISPECIES: BON domain-containing protein [unclassified Streptomyces]|uniref:BON domain-containing protein n=1 Tax=unclassified Streptomyces TaxID=2593676 RepID=UPI003D7445CB
MTGHHPRYPGTQPPPRGLDYRVARLGERLAGGPLGELGVHVDVHGDVVLLSGTVPTTECRDAVLNLAREELAGIDVHSDVCVADAGAPDHAEELS